DGDSESVGARNRVGNLAHAKIQVLRVGNIVSDPEAEVQMVKILRPVAVRPPQPRMIDMQRGSIPGIETHRLFAVRSQLNLPVEVDVFDRSFEHALSRLVADVLDRR